MVDEDIKPNSERSERGPYSVTHIYDTDYLLDENRIVQADRAPSLADMEGLAKRLNQHTKLVEALNATRRTLEALLTCDHCAACEYCNGHKIIRLEIAAIDQALNPKG